MARIYVASVGSVNEELMNMLGRFVKGMFGLEVERYTNLPSPDFAFDQRRNQYSSAIILQHLAPICPADGSKLIGITEIDLFIPMLTFVFGQAQLDGRAAIVSLCRLDQRFYQLSEDRELTVTRARKEIAHELGHTFGLVHCTEKNCLMSLSTEVAQIDRKSEDLCGSCWIELHEKRNIAEKGTEKKRILEFRR